MPIRSRYLALLDRLRGSTAADRPGSVDVVRAAGEAIEAQRRYADERLRWHGPHKAVTRASWYAEHALRALPEPTDTDAWIDEAVDALERARGEFNSMEEDVDAYGQTVFSEISKTLIRLRSHQRPAPSPDPGTPSTRRTEKDPDGADLGPPGGGRSEVELRRVFTALRAASKARRVAPSEEAAVLSACAFALGSRRWPHPVGARAIEPRLAATWPEAGVHVIEVGASLALVTLDGWELRLALEGERVPGYRARLSPDRRWLVASTSGPGYRLSGYDRTLHRRWSRRCWENGDWKDVEVSNDRVLLAYGMGDLPPYECLGELDLETGDDIRS
jgi:hypothetical protein